jgi:hypothetical protein
LSYDVVCCRKTHPVVQVTGIALLLLVREGEYPLYVLGKVRSTLGKTEYATDLLPLEAPLFEVLPLDHLGKDSE